MDNSPGSAAYAEHTAHIDVVLEGLQTTGELAQPAVDKLLDGHSAAELRRLVPLGYRRRVGAFFTPSRLRARVSDVLRDLPAETFLDPTCGAGDLLLAATATMDISATVQETLAHWGARLHGWDLHEEFIQAARRRVLLSALKRHHTLDGLVASSSGLLEHLVNIKQADAQVQESEQVDAVVLNPPFTRVPARSGCHWAQGKTSNAAIFFLEALKHLKPNGHIVAILPDSLRSGSNFSKWRTTVESCTNVLHVERSGIFDDHTDIDVFLLVAQVRGSGPPPGPVPWWREVDAGNVVGDLFEVRVGTVVDNRDPHEGENRPFLVARDLSSTGRMNVPSRRRLFGGRVFEPPFVAIRRTSRPSEGSSSRAAGVLITGSEAVAVDNHLLIAKPIKGGLRSCNALIKLLNSSAINQILDDRISCRHLTVSAVRQLPWDRQRF
ncbi:N-6 DNA methylase [Streptomyces sp. NPDC050625]|uniref:N-6 DNA methylase n=1 Tax=Streptomyces sp. NPDC050625 TaxID=3154629 RepID=UPI00343805E0